HQRAHGARRAPGGCDERHLSCCAGRHLDGGETAVKAMAYWTALYGTYVNWLTTTRAAVFGTAAKSPISAAGYTGQPWQENLVTAGFLTVSLSIIAASALVLWGLRPGRAVGSS